jgi:hypothetical protein
MSCESKFDNTERQAAHQIMMEQLQGATFSCTCWRFVFYLWLCILDLVLDSSIDLVVESTTRNAIRDKTDGIPMIARNTMV